MKPYLLLLAIFYCSFCDATAFLTKVSIDERTSKSSLIIEGKVIHQQSYWNVDKSSIFTVNTVEVNQRLKGSSTSVVEVIVPGGTIDGKMLVVEPNAELKIGSSGIFFLGDNTIPIKYSSSLKKYEIYSLAQGFIEKDNVTGVYSDPFDEYQNKSSLYNLVSKNTGINYRYSEENISNDVSSAIISSFSPSTITAGTQSLLTINGNGFGVRRGSATVQFRNANSTSSASFVSIPDSSYIVSWTNTQIVVIVPGASAFGQPGAGTGLVKVIDELGSMVSSSSDLTVTYNQFEYKKRRIAVIDQNGIGGYTFTFNTDFNNNTEAKASFIRGLDQWVCKTGINVNINPVTSANSCSNQLDNQNTVAFATASCPLPSGAIGITYSTYSVCTGYIIPDGIDILISPNTNFYYGTDQTANNQYDFETVILHELGHAFGQGHSSLNEEIMYPSVSNGMSKRVLKPATDIANVTDVINRSITTGTCGYQKHKKLTTTCTTTTTNAITAKFSTDKTVGCAPLTVHFTDNSTGNPTSWKWDIDNNLTTDYTTQNPSHTFTQPGTYTVKLVSYNSTTKDSIIKTAQVIVAPAINLSTQIIQNVTCNAGNNGLVQANPSGGNGVYSYVWSNSQTGQTASNLTAGNYSVTAKDGYNCSVTKSVTVSQPNPINISVNTQNDGQIFNATINVTGGTAPYTYILNNTSTYTNQVINNLTAGNYIVRVQDKNNCIQTSSFSLAAPTSIIDIEKNIDNLEIYPNPASNVANINISLKEYNSVHVELYNLSGQTFFQDDYTNIKDHRASIDLSTLSAGTYILKFGLPEGNTFRKIIVNR